MEREITLFEMMEARERRAQRQQVLLERCALPVISFTMNIAGPIKNGTGIRRAFAEGQHRLHAALRGEKIAVISESRYDEPTGCEALLALRGEGRAIKALCIALEDEDELGRLFDFDVLEPARGAWSRTALGYAERGCLICGRSGRACASARVHSAEELRKKTDEIIRQYFAEKDAQRIAALAIRALLAEVCTTPKPGLVDLADNGSHRDMSPFTFLASAAALSPYFYKAALLGLSTAREAAETAFDRLRIEGLRAEADMYAATQGINTHKGVVYSMGLVCTAAGRLWRVDGSCGDADRLLAECALLARAATESAYERIRCGQAETAGERLYLYCGQRGVRGEAAGGFPSVRDVALPAFRAALSMGKPMEQAGVYALLHLIAEVKDTNLAARGGAEAQRWTAQYAARLLLRGEGFDQMALNTFNAEMVERWLSPGGCADLLALTYFLYFLCEEQTRFMEQTEDKTAFSSEPNEKENTV